MRHGGGLLRLLRRTAKARCRRADLGRYLSPGGRAAAQKTPVFDRPGPGRIERCRSRQTCAPFIGPGACAAADKRAPFSSRRGLVPQQTNARPFCQTGAAAPDSTQAPTMHGTALCKRSMSASPCPPTCIRAKGRSGVSDPSPARRRPAPRSPAGAAPRKVPRAPFRAQMSNPSCEPRRREVTARLNDTFPGLAIRLRGNDTRIGSNSFHAFSRPGRARTNAASGYSKKARPFSAPAGPE